MRRICAWCGEVLETGPAERPSHAMCADCARKHADEPVEPLPPEAACACED